MRKLLVGALFLVGSTNAAYQRGTLAKMREHEVEQEQVQEVVEQALEQGVRPSEILGLIEREITYLLTHTK